MVDSSSETLYELLDTAMKETSRGTSIKTWYKLKTVPGV